MILRQKKVPFFVTGKKDNLHPKINGKTGTKIQTAQKKADSARMPGNRCRSGRFRILRPETTRPRGRHFSLNLIGQYSNHKKNDPADIRLTNIYRVVFGIKKSVIT